jgi:hypothetical protein
MYAGTVIILFFSSRTTSFISLSFKSFPKFCATSIDPAYGHSSPLLPRVNLHPGPPFYFPKNFAIKRGEIQQRAKYLFY